jgi:hypothetical protein
VGVPEYQANVLTRLDQQGEPEGEEALLEQE